MDYIPFHVPHIPESTYDAIRDVIKSGWLTTGPKVGIFETSFGQIINSKNSVAVSSCTAALHLAYLAHKLGPGDEVIVPSFTFCSTINTLVHVGVTPIFCDIDEKTLCLDPHDAERKITKKTKAIVIVHYGGMPADMDTINKLAVRHNLVVIEDAAHAFMTKYKGQYIGSGSNTTCFSFYATKNLTTSEGGMITSDNAEVVDFVQLMRMHGISKQAWNRYGKEGDWHYDVIAPGYKYNMTDIEAVLGIEQLKGVQTSIDKRKYLADKFKHLLRNNPNILLPAEVPYQNSQHAWHLFVIRVNDQSKISRDQLINELKIAGIGTSVHFIPNHMQSYYKNMAGNVSLSVTEKVYNSILSLPFYQDLTDEQVEYICANINHLTQ